MGFLKIILYFLIFYYVAKFVMRLLAPMMAKKMMDKAAQNFENQFNNPYYKQKSNVKEGETIIEKSSDSSNRAKNSTGDNEPGEYVDYEEVD